MQKLSNSLSKTITQATILIEGMARQDTYHSAVRNALEKDGWTITHDPLTIRLEDVKFYVDLAAEKIAENADETDKERVKNNL